MAPRLRPLALLVVLATLAGALRPAGAEPDDRSTLVAAARAFHAAVESGDLARIARFGCTVKGPFTDDEVREAGKSVFGTLKKIRGRPWEFGPEIEVRDVPGAKRLSVKTSPTSALLLTGVPFEGRWCFLSVDELKPEEFTPRDTPLVDPAPSLEPAPAVDPEVEKAVKEVVATMRRVPAAGDDASSWLLWRRQGIRELPRGLVGDLHEMLQTLRAPDEPAPSSLLISSGGTAPHRYATARISYPVDATLPLRRSWTVLLIEADGWRVARADAELEGPVLPVTLSPQVVADAGRVVEAAEALLTAVDSADAKGFAARSASLVGPDPRRPTEADVKAQLEELHVKYGARPHKVGRPAPDRLGGRDGMTVPVLFGDAEDLLYLVFVDEKAEWRLASVSEGSPADFVERAAPPAPK